MKPIKLTNADHEDLISLLNAAFDEAEAETEEIPTVEEVTARLRRVCLLAYSVTRDAFHKGNMRKLSDCAINNMESKNNLNSATGALIMQTFANFASMHFKQDEELFKLEFIQALDNAVEEAGHLLKEEHDTRTKQSAS